MTESPRPRTIVEKIWDAHVVTEEPDAPAILYIDQHLVHEVTSPQAFDGLRRRGLKVRRPDRTFATTDHSTPTTPPDLGIADPIAAAQVAKLEENCRELGIPCEGFSSRRQGIVHVIAPEQGRTHPGMTLVCGDSHTATHGAFGALAFGIGTSEVEHVLATQCVLQRRSRTFEVRVDGRMPAGVVAKDLILALIARIGVGGGTGCVIEYTGAAIRALSMEERMTVCNMSIEAGARAGMIAPDETTFEYLLCREHAPPGDVWETAIERWKRLPSDPGAHYDRTLTIDADALEPMITFGTNPAMGIRIGDPVPDPSAVPGGTEREALAKALRYMDLAPGRPLTGQRIDVVFLGSCTNSRLSDLRAAGKVLAGRKVHERVRMIVVPGSREVKRHAEAEGLHRVFREAGAEWREPGCSMCIAMNGDQLEPGQYCVSTSNRNFEGRQGKGGRTFLASPLTAAASAIAGCVADARPLLRGPA